MFLEGNYYASHRIKLGGLCTMISNASIVDRRRVVVMFVCGRLLGHTQTSGLQVAADCNHLDIIET